MTRDVTCGDAHQNERLPELREISLFFALDRPYGSYGSYSASCLAPATVSAAVSVVIKTQSTRIRDGTRSIGYLLALA